MVKEKKDLKLLFVKPCLRPGGFTKLLPVGLASVMTYFETKGYDFTLLDIDIDEFDDAYVENYIKKNHFDIILTGTIVTHYKWIKWFVNMAKTHQPNSKIIVGNSVAGSIPELFLQKTKCDIIVIGEGEISAYEAVEAIRLGKEFKDIPGIAFRNNNGKIVKNEHRKVGDINDFPFINWDRFEVERYITQPETFPDKEANPEELRALPVITARGCAFKCSFCHFVFWDDPYRNRKPKSVLDEIRQLQEKYNVKYINFWDDLSFASAIQMEKFCDEILSSGLKFKWLGAVRVDLFSRGRAKGEDALRVAKKMKESGCYSVGFALESGNKEILKMMNKEIDPKEFYDTATILRKAGIISQTTVLFGYPQETKKTIKETFDQCLKAGLYPSIGFLMPLPYTVMYDYAKVNGYITDEDKYLESITERQDITINMTKMSDKEIMDEIKVGAKKLNDMLDLGLTEETYIRTGGYKNRLDNLEKQRPRLNPKKIKRNVNDVSFNYAQTDFKFEEQAN
tara:strand:+ start:170 stop:1699 length:1530 start_codon:yes stop_codon:yes gene_type:complete